ncbi:MAG TPA: hypothetical protein VF746_13315 [Longimicrobium sp.]
MRIDVTADARQVERAFGSLARDQMPFATSRAINATAFDVDEAATRQLAGSFTVRRRDFASRAFKPGPAATKTRLHRDVKLEPPGGAQRADIFAKFEHGGVKKPQGTRLAIPESGVRRTRAGIVAPSLRPRALDFKAQSPNVLIGKNRTVMIRTAGGKGIILQRTGRGRKGRRGRRVLVSDLRTRKVRDVSLKVLYGLAPRARIDGRLEFFPTAEKTVQTVFPEHLKRELMKAVVTRR